MVGLLLSRLVRFRTIFRQNNRGREGRIATDTDGTAETMRVVETGIAGDCILIDRE